MKHALRALVYVGIAATVGGLSLVHARIIADPPYSYTGTFRFGWSILYVLLLVVMAYGFGLPEVPRSPRQALTAAVGASSAAALAISVVQLVVGDALLPRFVVFGSAFLLTPWYLVCVALSGGGGSSATRDRALVIGEDLNAASIREDVGRNPERPVVVVEVLPVTAIVGDGVDRPLVERVAKERISLVVLDRDAQASEDVVAQVAALHEAGTRVRTLSLFYDEWLGMLPMSELERVSLMFDIGEVHRAEYGRVKRVVDLALALLGILVLALLVPLVFVVNLFANRGPLFYRQERVGKAGSTFSILKFRTMRSAQEMSTEWTTERDPRITPFGRVLRKSHLDEVPQVVNILRGDLSVVGPRPEQPRYVSELVEKLPFYDMRHLVRPGLTGWAQVKYGYAGDQVDAMEKLKYDFYYLRHQSLGLDLRIVGRTVRSVLGGEGR